MNGNHEEAVEANGSLLYQPKNILLTGGAGFIGSHVVSLLVHRYPNYKVHPPPSGLSVSLTVL